MASKFMANAAFEARLLLRPSHQRTVWTVNKLKYPIPGRPALPPILSSRSYSDSTSTPPLPKSSGSTKSSQSSGPKDKIYSDSTPTPPFPKSSGPTECSQSSGPEDKNWIDPKAMAKVVGAVALGLLSIGGIITYATQPIWLNRYNTSLRLEHESLRESAIYDKLKKGPVFDKAMKHPIPRIALVEEIRQVTTPAEESGLYPLIIGEHGTGKTSLIQLAVDGLHEPKGVVYVDADIDDDSQIDIAKVMRMALGWSPDQVIDSSKPASLWEVLQVFSRLAIKYKQEYGKIPVLIIDNANKLAQNQQKLLNLLQDYAESAADKGIVSVVFVSSGGRVPRCMTQRASWSRSGLIIEMSDLSKEEALEYLKLREFDEKQAAQIYELVGGRMIHLKFMADEIKRNKTFEDMRKAMLSKAKGQLTSAEILPDSRYHKDRAKIVRELIKKGSISEDAYYSLVGRDMGNKLLEKDIFAYHFNSEEITFQSTVMKRYCEKNSADWEGK